MRECQPHPASRSERLSGELLRQAWIAVLQDQKQTVDQLYLQCADSLTQSLYLAFAGPKLGRAPLANAP